MPLTESLTPDLCLWRTIVLKNCFIQCRDKLVACDVQGVGFSEMQSRAFWSTAHILSNNFVMQLSATTYRIRIEVLKVQNRALVQKAEAFDQLKAEVENLKKLVNKNLIQLTINQ